MDWLREEVAIARWILLLVVLAFVLNLARDLLEGHWVTVVAGLVAWVLVYAVIRARQRHSTTSP